jgi:tRNA nucleotidyltransferase/poly(A) polymerase
MTTTLTLPQAAQEVLETLNQAGYPSFFAGGCVRDRALGIVPKDYDITTTALPEQVTTLFEKTLQVGAHFGVVVVLFAGYQFEVATFRADGEYKDGRRPETVRYSTDVREDVTRRDFTINGMVQSSVFGQPMDFVEGLPDIEAKIIRTIGDPEKRFSEDALRMLRAVRFVSKLGFTIEPNTLAAIQKNAASLQSVSRERIREELFQILTGKCAVEGIVALFTTGLAKHVDPDFMSMELGYTLARFQRFPTTDPMLALTMFLSDLAPVDGDPQIRYQRILESFKLPSKTEKMLRVGMRETLSRFTRQYQVSNASLIRAMREEGFLSLQLPLFIQDLEMGKSPFGDEEIPQYAVGRGMTKAKAIVRFCTLTPAEVVNQKRFIDGADLLVRGSVVGEALGALLHQLETKQLNGEFTSREEALAFIDVKEKTQ